MTNASEFDSGAPTTVLDRMPRFVLLAEQWTTALGGLILIASMAITTIDVVGRYVFNRPLGFAYEVTELLMASVVYVSLASVTLRNEHITIGVFNDVWHGRIGAARDLFLALFMVACTAFLCYRMFLFTGRFIRYGDITNMLKFPLYPVAALGAIGIGLASLAALVLALEALRRLVRGAA